MEVGRNAVAQFLHGVNTGGLEELGKLTGYALDAEEIGMVCPFQNQFLGNTCLFSQLFTAFLRGSLFEQFFGSFHTCHAKLIGVHVANAFDIDNFVRQNGGI